MICIREVIYSVCSRNFCGILSASEDFMTHDEMMSLLANTLADAAGSSGCLPILDCFSPHPGEEVTVSIPMCDDTVDIVLEDLDFPHEWEELLENSGADTMGDLVDYLCYCSQNNISLAISPEDEEKLYATLIDVCYENMSYDRQVDFWRHVLETNSLVCEVKNDPAGAALRKNAGGAERLLLMADRTAARRNSTSRLRVQRP